MGIRRAAQEIRLGGPWALSGEHAELDIVQRVEEIGCFTGVFDKSRKNSSLARFQYSNTVEKSQLQSPA